MPKIVINIPLETNKELKILALKNGRSLSQFIPRYLTQCIKNSVVSFDKDGEMIFSNPSTSTSFALDPTSLPEGATATATVKVKAQKPLTPEEIEEQKRQTFLNKCKQMLGEKTYKNWEPDIVREFIVLTPDSNYYNDAERIPDKGIRMAYSMSEDKQDKYIADIKAYIDHEEGR